MFTMMFFMILMLTVFGKLIGLAFRMTWGIGRILLEIVFLPVVLIFMAVTGLLKVAFVLLAVIGILALIRSPGSAR